MCAGTVVAMDKKWHLSLSNEQEDVLSVEGCLDFRARFALCSPEQLSSIWARMISSMLVQQVSVPISEVSRHFFAWRWLNFGAYGPPLHHKICN